MFHKKTSKYIFSGLLILFLVGIVLELFWGKLFPYSPVKLGFTKHELPTAVVYLQGDSNFDLSTIDSLVSSVEQSHRLFFLHKPEIVVFHDSLSYLQRSTTKARFYAYPKACLIVAPWAVREDSSGVISMKIYLSHELSHTLLYQHMDYVSVFFYPRWLLEGIAVYRAHQMGTSWYPSKEETYRLMREGNFMPPEDFNTSKEQKIPLHTPYPIAFEYSEFACMVDYLIERYGAEQFTRYTTELMSSCRPEQTFFQVYGVDLDTCLNNFRLYVNKKI